MAALPGCDTLRRGSVVQQAGMPQHTLKLPLLLWSRLERVLEGLAHARPWHGYFSPSCLAAYSRKAQITSPLKDRSCLLARARIAFNTSNGKRIEMRRSPFCVFSMYPFYHTHGHMVGGRYVWLTPGGTSPLGLHPSGLRRAKAFPCPTPTGTPTAPAPASQPHVPHSHTPP